MNTKPVAPYSIRIRLLRMLSSVVRVIYCSIHLLTRPIRPRRASDNESIDKGEVGSSRPGGGPNAGGHGTLPPKQEFGKSICCLRLHWHRWQRLHNSPSLHAPLRWYLHAFAHLCGCPMEPSLHA